MLIGLACVVLSQFLRPDLAVVALGMGCVLVTLGLLCNGFSELLGITRKSETSRDEPGV